MVGRKRNFDESKQEDLMYCKTSSKEEGPPKKKHWTLVKFCFRNPVVPPEQSEYVHNQTSTSDARKERSRKIDLEALERRRIMAQQQQMLDNDPVAREIFLQAYAERLGSIKQHRSMNRVYEKLSPCHYHALYNIHKKLG
jgi:hypothetical protein